jgi:hypothetical protein
MKDKSTSINRRPGEKQTSLSGNMDGVEKFDQIFRCNMKKKICA